jgi:hypothetical protein
MEKNVGGWDRQARYVLGGGLALAGGAGLAAGVVGTTVAAMAVAGGGALLLNALTQRCLWNRLLGIDTCGENC